MNPDLILSMVLVCFIKPALCLCMKSSVIQTYYIPRTSYTSYQLAKNKFYLSSKSNMQTMKPMCSENRAAVQHFPVEVMCFVESAAFVCAVGVVEQPCREWKLCVEELESLLSVLSHACNKVSCPCAISEVIKRRSLYTGDCQTCTAAEVQQQ